MAERGPEPRDFLERPDLFGDRSRLEPLKWKKPGKSLAEKGRLAAAYYQHLAAFQVRRALEDRPESVEQLATRLGITADTLRRKLRGEDRVALEEVLAWALDLGVDILPAPGESSDLLP